MGMVRWVEEGKAPDVIVGTEYSNGTRTPESSFKRRHCRWPHRNKYAGDGDGTDIDGWSCFLVFHDWQIAVLLIWCCISIFYGRKDEWVVNP